VTADAEPGAAKAPGSKPSSEAADQKVSDAVAHAVKVGYDVIAENIRQGREAAERFRQGEYSLREAPVDIEIAALRLLHLARELSTTTFDVCERLLKELGALKPPGSARAPPPFPDPADYPSTAKAKPPTAPAPGATEAMKITVRFAGGEGVAHTVSLGRPRRPTEPDNISAAPLAPAKAGGKPIAGVSFQADVSVDGLIVLVTLPKGQAPGIYSGLVHAGEDPVPLGVLTIEVPK
jgi:hypothetical protein